MYSIHEYVNTKLNESLRPGPESCPLICPQTSKTIEQNRGVLPIVLSPMINTFRQQRKDSLRRTYVCRLNSSSAAGQTNELCNSTRSYPVRQYYVFCLSQTNSFFSDSTDATSSELKMTSKNRKYRPCYPKVKPFKVIKISQKAFLCTSNL